MTAEMEEEIGLEITEEEVDEGVAETEVSSAILSRKTLGQDEAAM